MNGEEIRKILADKGIQQTDIARDLGMSKQSFGQMLSGKDLKSGFLERIAKYLGLTIHGLYEACNGGGESSVTAKMENLRSEMWEGVSRAEFEQMKEELRRKDETISKLLEQQQQLISVLLKDKEEASAKSKAKTLMFGC